MVQLGCLLRFWRLIPPHTFLLRGKAPPVCLVSAGYAGTFCASFVHALRTARRGGRFEPALLLTGLPLRFPRREPLLPTCLPLRTRCLPAIYTCVDMPVLEHFSAQRIRTPSRARFANAVPGWWGGGTFKAGGAGNGTGRRWFAGICFCRADGSWFTPWHGNVCACTRVSCSCSFPLPRAARDTACTYAARAHSRHHAHAFCRVKRHYLLWIGQCWRTISPSVLLLVLHILYLGT